MSAILKQLASHGNWRQVRFGHLIRRSREDGSPDLEPLSVFLDEGVVPRSSRDDNHNRLGADMSKYLVVHPGDLVFNKLRTWQGGFGRSDHEGIVSPAYYVCRPTSDVDTGFLRYLLKSKPGLAELTRVSKWMPPAQFDILWEDLRNLKVPVPPLPTQGKIAGFLDRETERIDALIDKKRRLIDLLEEKRTATITHAVTKGLDPTAQMKPSNIPWLGDIPEHWEAEELKRWWTVTDCLHRTATYVDDGVPLVGTVQVKPGRLSLKGAKMTTETEYTDLAAGPRLPTRGDIIYSRNASLGSAAYVDIDDRFTMGQDVCLIRSTDEDQLYLSYFLASRFAAQQVDAAVVGATFKRINVEQIKNFAVTRPPLDEQVAIARYLDRQTQLMDRATRMLTTQLALLGEYREALITAAVTGEIDVDTFDNDRNMEEATA